MSVSKFVGLATRPRQPVHAMTADHLLIWGAEAQVLDSFNTSRLLEVLIEELGHES